MKKPCFGNHPQRRTANNVCRTMPAVILCIFFILTPAGTLQAEPQVTAQYTQSTGRELLVEITVPAPPPASIILVQSLPPGVIIGPTQPEANSINQEKGEAKWLLRNLQPGKLTVRISLDREVRRDEISGEIRYKTPQGKGMASIQVR